MSDSKHDDVFFYEQTRKQIEHEDILLNHRLTWLITSQGLLYSGYALSSSKPELEDLHKALPFIGIFSSICIFIGIFAAANSIQELARKWIDRKVSHSKFPQVIGNFEQIGTLYGLIPVYVLPLISSGSWAYLHPTLITKFLVLAQLMFFAHILYRSICAQKKLIC